MGGRRTLIERFNLDDEIPLGEWFVVVDTCIKLGRAEPAKLALVDALTFNATIAKYELKIETSQLWRACVLVFVDTSAGSSLALKGVSGDAESLIIRLKAVSLAGSAIRKEVSDSMHSMKLPKSFSDLGPSAKLAKLRQSTVSKDK